MPPFHQLKRTAGWPRYILGALGLFAVALPGQQGAPVSAPAGAAERIDYNWQVRPILADNCFRCHGPDAKARQAGLRLDQKESAYAQAMTPGKPEQSEIVSRISSTDPSYRMPPPLSSAKGLTPAEIRTITQWIKEGAEYKPHWAFVAPVKASLPAVAGNAPGNAIDRFIHARLEKEGLKAAPEANRETLINRVTLQLTGLPPALSEVDAFLADKSANAYEKVVDRLLAAPAYGENMASYWMNIARYSESDGFLDDHHDRMFWPYRDWVISAFNKNMPFNQFSTWQIAGDLLPHANAEQAKEQKLATAFLRVGKRTSENGAIDEEYRVEYALDRANTIGQGFLALTTGCARCHDHKYDPIAQKDYYALTGYFNNADEPGFFAPGFSTIQGGPTLRWTSAENEAKIAAAETKAKAAEKADRAVREKTSAEVAARIAALLKQSPDEMAAVVEKSVQSATVAYYPFETTAPIPDDQLPKSRARGKLAPPELVSPFRKRGGQAPPPPKEDATAAAEQAKAFARRLPNSMIRENLVFSPSGLPQGEPAVLEEASIRPGGAKGNAFFFTDTNRGFLGKSVGFYDRTEPYSFDLWIYAGAVYETAQVLNHRDDDNSGGAGYRLRLEQNHLSFYMMHSWPYNMLHVISKQQIPVKQWTHVAMTYDGSSRAAGIQIYVDGQRAEVDVEHDQLTESSLPRSFSPAFNEFVGVEFGRRFRELTMKDGAIDEIRFFNRALTPLEVSYLHQGAAAVNAAKTDAALLRRELTEVMVANEAPVAESAKAVHAAREAENQAVSWVPEVMVMADQPAPRQTYVLSRGLYNVHLDPVEPGTLTQVFPLDPKLPKNRLGLAQWLFDPKNPLVARVFVNRMWQQMMGRGIVETSEDFGMQGSRPTHPELLDWLAVDFVESGWDVKRLMKMIAMSETFRQSSDANEEELKKDPGNMLYARGPRFRMSAEQIRDQALAVSGLLVDTVGGPSAHPYQADGIWVPGVTQYTYPKPEELAPEEQHRRSLYTFVKRNTPPPSMTVFDFSERHQTIARRLTSNTPLQALVLMDDPQYLEAYRVLATRVLKEQKDKTEQIRTAFRFATRRWPNAAELDALRSYYDGQMVLFDGDRQKAGQRVKVGVAPVDSTVDVAQMAALSDVVAAIMNTPDAYSIH